MDLSPARVAGPPSASADASTVPGIPAAVEAHGPPVPMAHRAADTPPVPPPPCSEAGPPEGGFPASSSSSSSAPPPSGDMGPLAKRRRLFVDIMAEASGDFAEGLSAEELKALSTRLQVLSGEVSARLLRVAPGESTAEPCVSLLRSDFKKTYGKGKHASHTIIRTARIFARIGDLPVMFWARATEVVEAEASFSAFKLVTVLGDGSEGELLYPPAPYDPPADGDGDTDVLMMPLAQMQAIRERCGLPDDPRPANEWMRAVLRVLIRGLAERHGQQLGDGVCDNFDDVLADHFDPKYIPPYVMSVADMVKGGFMKA